MNNSLKRTNELQAGKVGWILLWALGVPIPRAAHSLPHARVHLGDPASQSIS